MKPRSLTRTTITRTPPSMGPIEDRFGEYPKGTILPETQAPACPRRKVADFREGFLKTNHIEALEHNQKISSCCRHPENHEVEARKSHPDEKTPDIYIFHCTCGRKHRFFCIGEEDIRPEWS